MSTQGYEFKSIGDLDEGMEFQLVMGGPQYRLEGICRRTSSTGQMMFVCRRVGLDGPDGSYFVLEGERPVCLRA